MSPSVVRPESTSVTTSRRAASMGLPLASSSSAWYATSTARYSGSVPRPAWPSSRSRAASSTRRRRVCASARPAASRAATGSIAERSSVRASSWAPRPGPPSRHRISRGSKGFHSRGARTVTPTRRRDSTIPIDSSTRTTSRTSVRETPNSASRPASVRTVPGGRAPEAMLSPSRSSTPLCCSTPCMPLRSRSAGAPGSLRGAPAGVPGAGRAPPVAKSMIFLSA